MGKPTGLDYRGVQAYLDERKLHGRKRREVFQAIQEAERETLEVWAEQSEREAKQQQSGR